MSWLFQKTGIINHYNPKAHYGSQPIRVIHNMLIYMFQNTNAGFSEEMLEQISLGKMDKEIQIIVGNDPITIEPGKLRTPKINLAAKKIEIHETFLSFLWGSVYSVFTNYCEKIDFPAVNKANKTIVHELNEENVKLADAVFDYAKYLIIDFEPWNKDELPNPEVYPANNRMFVGRTNIFYTEAMKFILCHEFTHLKFHVGQINSETTDSHYLIFEVEADNYAIALMKKGMFQMNYLAVECGIIFGILSMFFFSAKTTGIKHPNFEDRLTNALERLDLVNNVHAWGIACMGLKKWDNMFGLDLSWSDEPVSYKQEYYLILKQIKAQQSK